MSDESGALTLADGRPKAAEEIELVLRKHLHPRGVESVMVVGSGLPFLACLLTLTTKGTTAISMGEFVDDVEAPLDLDGAALTHAKDAGSKATNAKDAASDAAFRAKVVEPGLAAANKELGDPGMQVKRFCIAPAVFGCFSGELNFDGSLDRAAVLKQFQGLVDGMYDGFAPLPLPRPAAPPTAPKEQSAPPPPPKKAAEHKAAESKAAAESPKRVATEAPKQAPAPERAAAKSPKSPAKQADYSLPTPPQQASPVHLPPKDHKHHHKHAKKVPPPLQEDTPKTFISPEPAPEKQASSSPANGSGPQHAPSSQGHAAGPSSGSDGKDHWPFCTACGEPNTTNNAVCEICGAHVDDLTPTPVASPAEIQKAIRTHSLPHMLPLAQEGAEGKRATEQEAQAAFRSKSAQSKSLPAMPVPDKHKHKHPHGPNKHDKHAVDPEAIHLDPREPHVVPTAAAPKSDPHPQTSLKAAPLSGPKSGPVNSSAPSPKRMGSNPTSPAALPASSPTGPASPSKYTLPNGEMMPKSPPSMANPPPTLLPADTPGFKLSPCASEPTKVEIAMRDAGGEIDPRPWEVLRGVRRVQWRVKRNKWSFCGSNNTLLACDATSGEPLLEYTKDGDGTVAVHQGAHNGKHQVLASLSSQAKSMLDLNGHVIMSPLLEITAGEQHTFSVYDGNGNLSWNISGSGKGKYAICPTGPDANNHLGSDVGYMKYNEVNLPEGADGLSNARLLSTYYLTQMYMA